MKVKPLENRVLLNVRKSEEKTKSGIYLPEDAQEKKQEGTVVAIGPGKDSKPLPLKEGDLVLYEKYGGTEIDINGEKHLLVDMKDILAVIEK